MPGLPSPDISTGVQPKSPESPKPAESKDQATQTANSGLQGKDNFRQKSPHELAAQMQDVHGVRLAYKKIPDAEQLEARYNVMKDYVKGLLEAGIVDDQLSAQLNELHKEGYKSGIYDPLKGDNAQKFVDAEKAKNIEYGFSEKDADDAARESLSRAGYVDALRRSRSYSERAVDDQFEGFLTDHPIPPEVEEARIANLRERCRVIDNSEQSSAFQEDFPGGNFLFHSTTVEGGVKILENGELVNAKTLNDREEEKANNGGEKVTVKRNSGYEGISWSFNEIDALPGDRYHLVGFLASPNTVLNPHLQLAIPSRPAPNELILLNKGIEVAKYYDTKVQQELFESVNFFGESNSVFSNLLHLSLLRKEQVEGKLSGYAESILETYFQNKIPQEEVEKQLKSMFTVRENGTIELSPLLSQQIKKDIPVAAVWLQAMVDTGRIKDVTGFENVVSVQEIVKRLTGDNIKDFFPELKKDRNYLDGIVKEEDDKVTSIAVPTSEMYFVVPDMDLEKWLKVLARCKDVPKGIVVYNRAKVRLENFASLHKGDHDVLTQELQRIIPPAMGRIDYESEILGTEITPDKLAGARMHVVGEEHLGKRRSLIKNEDGEVIAA